MHIRVKIGSKGLEVRTRDPHTIHEQDDVVTAAEEVWALDSVSPLVITSNQAEAWLEPNGLATKQVYQPVSEVRTRRG